MAAVLEDAINILRKRPRSRAGREAREWLASRDASWPFAFERICDVLDLDADSVRDRSRTGATSRGCRRRRFERAPGSPSAPERQATGKSFPNRIMNIRSPRPDTRRS
jgi:hypothetical protein